MARCVAEVRLSVFGAEAEAGEGGRMLISSSSGKNHSLQACQEREEFTTKTFVAKKRHHKYSCQVPRCCDDSTCNVDGEYYSITGRLLM